MFGLGDQADKNLTPGTPVDTNLSMPPAMPGSAVPNSPSNRPVVPATMLTIPLPPPADPAINNGTINDVNLEKAYIATDPTNVSVPAADNTFTKPMAASLLASGQEEDLLKLKQQALQSLAPLVDHLDQTPEERFKTTMMLIQASDNAELIPEAYDAANKITDEKVRAQALLDVVNEINYFTQQGISVAGPSPS